MSKDVYGTPLTDRLRANQEIFAHSLSQIRSFLEELKHGTKKYRTIASLSSQLAEAYRGRCVLELLQNAHDAMNDTPSDDPGRVSFLLKTKPSPLLLVANSGLAFKSQDFKGLCQLGQSPKDPNKSVGNKGLGFRSVLEVASAPEIWSTSATEGEPAFVFHFHPEVRETVATTLTDLDKNGLDACSPFDSSERLVDWTENQLQTYRDRLVQDGLDASSEAWSYFSPYDIPLAIDERRDEVDELLANGHVSVVCLPLDGGRAGDSGNAINFGALPARRSLRHVNYPIFTQTKNTRRGDRRRTNGIASYCRRRSRIRGTRTQSMSESTDLSGIEDYGRNRI